MKTVISTILVFCFFLVPVAFWLKHYHPFGDIKEFVFASASIAAFCTLLASFVLDGKIRLKKDKTIFLVVLFYLYNLISFGFQRYTSQNDMFLLTTLVMLVIVVSYAVDASARNRILQTLIVVSFLSFIYSALQFSGIDFLGFVRYFESKSDIGARTFSFFGNPNLLGGFCVFIIPVTLSFLLKSLTGGDNKRGPWVPVFYGLALGLAVMTLLMSQTRSSWIAWFSSMAAFALLYYRDKIAGFFKKRMIRAGVVVLIVTTGFSALYLAGENLRPVENDTGVLSDATSLGLRFFYYVNTIDMIQEKPLFGRGLGTFNVYYPLYRDKRAAFHLGEESMEYRVEHPHNEHLEMLSDLGIIGYALFITLVCFALRALLKKRDIISLGIAVSMMGLLVDGLMTQNMRFVVVSSLFWLSVGCSTIGAVSKQHYSLSISKLVLLIVIFSLGVVGIGYRYRLMTADHYVKEGIKYHISSSPDKYKGAAYWFGRTLAVDRHNKLALYYLAYAEKKLGYIRNAKAHYGQLLFLDPNFLQVNFFLGQIYSEKRDISQAKKYFDRQVRVNNMYWRGFYGVAFVNKRLGNIEKAADALEEIREIQKIQEIPLKEYKRILGLLIGIYGDDPRAENVRMEYALMAAGDD